MEKKEIECIRCGMTKKDIRKYQGGCSPGYGAHFKRHDYSKPFPKPSDGILKITPSTL